MKKGNKGLVKKWSWRYFEYKPETHRLNYSEEQKFGQKKYIETVLVPIDEVALKRCHKSVARTNQEPLAQELLPLYGTACGQLQWVLSSRHWWSTSMLA